MCDTNGDNNISFEEFVQGAINHTAVMNKANIETIFDMIDLNGDG
jgi:Ca2+-binding EF-hand superfamily protein